MTKLNAYMTHKAEKKRKKKKEKKKRKLLPNTHHSDFS